MGLPENINISTGNSRIDFEHFQILHTIERLQNKHLSQTARIELCESLLHYINEHCQDEEKLMGLYNYPERDSHEEAHRVLQSNFLKTISSFIKVGDVDDKIVYSLFYNHILFVDIPMIKYVQHKELERKQSKLNKKLI